ncbi:MAG: exodeoxyribonuclease VII small subunit [Verrucomicrobiae bacterium]|nr:exodeoxyribonuclease VII small subunit [Verrucomicrobiae bacterium]
MPESSNEDAIVLPNADPDLTFEQAYGRLEGLVREMESDEMPLSILIEAYERGIQLHALCQTRLEEAQGRIELIRRRASGETVVEPFDESGAEAGAKTATEANSDAAPTSLKANAELF